jgi:hypothetical protein
MTKYIDLTFNFLFISIQPIVIQNYVGHFFAYLINILNSTKQNRRKMILFKIVLYMLIIKIVQNCKISTDNVSLIFVKHLFI